MNLEQWRRIFNSSTLAHSGRTVWNKMEGLLGGGGGNYVGSSPATGYDDAKMIRQPNLQQRLDMAVASAEERLKLAKEARAIFDRNPDLEKLLNIMQKGIF